MFKIKKFLILLFLHVDFAKTVAQQNNITKNFKTPPLKCRSVPFWRLNGELNTITIKQQVANAAKSGLGGIAVLPVTAGPQHPT